MSDLARYRRLAQYWRDQASLRPNNETWLKLADEYARRANLSDQAPPPPSGPQPQQVQQQQAKTEKKDE